MMRFITRHHLFFEIVLLFCAPFIKCIHGTHNLRKQNEEQLHQTMKRLDQDRNVRNSYLQNGREITHPGSESDNVESAGKKDNGEPVKKVANAGPVSHEDDVEMDVFAKRVIGEDVIVTNLRRTPSIPTYVLKLYNAIEEEVMFEGNTPETHNDIPTIRTLKPYSMRSRFWYIFKLKNHYTHTNRLEIVLKLAETAGKTWDMDATYRISLFTSEHGWRYYDGRRYEEFLIVNISEDRDNKDLMIVVSRRLQVGNQRRRISRRFEPILVAFENKINNPLFREPNRVKRNQMELERGTPNNNDGRTPAHHISSFEQHAGSHGVTRSDFYHCRRYDWTINMRSFNWSWYAFPPSLNAGFCSGECPFPLDVEMLNSTNHSFLKSRWRVSSNGLLDDSVPGECCTPVSYLPASIIYLSSSMEYVMRDMPNMRVSSCGCR